MPLRKDEIDIDKAALFLLKKHWLRVCGGLFFLLLSAIVITLCVYYYNLFQEQRNLTNFSKLVFNIDFPDQTVKVDEKKEIIYSIGSDAAPYISASILFRTKKTRSEIESYFPGKTILCPGCDLGSKYNESYHADIKLYFGNRDTVDYRFLWEMLFVDAYNSKMPFSKKYYLPPGEMFFVVYSVCPDDNFFF